MSRVYIISFWILLGTFIAFLVNWLAPKDLDSLLKYSFPFTFAMFSLNFSAISACSNALLKYKELHSDKRIDIVVLEIKKYDCDVGRYCYGVFGFFTKECE